MINVRYNGVRMLSERYNIPVHQVEQLYDDGIIRECDLRKLLLKEEYSNRKAHESKGRLRDMLAVKYCISVSLVEKIVLNDTQKI